MQCSRSKLCECLWLNGWREGNEENMPHMTDPGWLLNQDNHRIILPPLSCMNKHINIFLSCAQPLFPFTFPPLSLAMNYLALALFLLHPFSPPLSFYLTHLLFLFLSLLPSPPFSSSPFSSPLFPSPSHSLSLTLSLHLVLEFEKFFLNIVMNPEVASEDIIVCNININFGYL